MTAELVTGTSLREARSKLGLSQEDLARRLGVSFATVSRWENGKTLPSNAHREALRRIVASANREATAEEGARRRPLRGFAFGSGRAAFEDTGAPALLDMLRTTKDDLKSLRARLESFEAELDEMIHRLTSDVQRERRP